MESNKKEFRGVPLEDSGRAPTGSAIAPVPPSSGTSPSDPSRKQPGIMNKTITCPICKGDGCIQPPRQRKSKVADNAVMAKLLSKEGYSQREIQRYLGYKSSRSVALLLKRK